jgi:hypothetical protein
LRREPFLRLAPALGEAALRGAQRALFGLQLRQPPVRLRDSALRVAQPIARFAPRALLLLDFFRQRVDARAKLCQFLLPRLRLRDADQQQEKERADQTLALPCAATAAMRFAISAGSPR